MRRHQPWGGHSKQNHEVVEPIKNQYSKPEMCVDPLKPKQNYTKNSTFLALPLLCFQLGPKNPERAVSSPCLVVCV